MYASPEPRRYRGAIIGLGNVARQSHVPAYRLEPAASRLTLAAVCEPAPHTVPPVDVALVRNLFDLSELVGPLDFVDICTPTGTHLDLTLACLERGWHVLCEKPVATTRAEADYLRRAAARAGRVVMPCHQYRYNPAWRQMRAWLDAGTIGRWHLAELDVYRAHADRGNDKRPVPWRARAAAARGGVLLDHGTHLVYELLDLAGAPAAVRAWTGRLRHRDYDVEDSAHLLLEYPERLARIFLTWGGPRREAKVRFVGELGTIEWVGGILMLERGGITECFDYSAELDKTAYARWYADLFSDFAAALDGGTTAPLDDITAVADVLDAAYRSAASGGVATAPGGPPATPASAQSGKRRSRKEPVRKARVR
ncbi:MAG TPA: Gfo/Idh/MocA family oxidoreductase [Gemmatimonadales bacterium]|nr:Gfo/Idh/MocA family oxidoreductase [Gemmatimonadales bacterium]